MTFNSISALRANTTTPTANEVVQVLGYYQSNDGGGGDFYWDSTSAVADNGGTVIKQTSIATGRWKRRVSNPGNPLWFGARGDGSTNDAAALNSAVTELGNLKLDMDLCGKVYAINSIITISKAIKVFNGTIKATASMSGACVSVTASNVSFDGFTLDGNNLNNFGVDMANISNCRFINSHVRNLKEINGATGIITRGISINNGASDIWICKSTFTNIVPVEDGVVGNPAGSGRGILCAKAQRVLIEDNVFDNIQGLEDGDAIQVVAVTGGVVETAEVMIRGNRFYNVYKRAIKTQAAGCIITDNVIYSLITDPKGSNSGISIFGSDTKVSNNKIYLERSTTGIEVNGGTAGAPMTGIVIDGNEVRTNVNNDYSATADTDILSYVLLAGYIKGMTIARNKFDGYARLYQAENSTLDSCRIEFNEFNGGGVVSGANSQSKNLTIAHNVFVGPEIATNPGTFNVVLLALNPDGLTIANNTFVWPKNVQLSLKGAITGRGVYYFGNKVTNTTSALRLDLTGVTGLQNLFVEYTQTKKVLEGTAAPTTGSWVVGDTVYNTAPGASGPEGWICTTAGTPGTWSTLTF